MSATLTGPSLAEGKPALSARRGSLASQPEERFGTRQFWGMAWPEWVALSLYSAIAIVTVRFHEPWADEAQAWLIARDLPFVKMLMQVKYEGTPPLWHALLWLLIRLRLPYSQIGMVSTAVMIAAVYIWLRHSPVMRLVRWLAPFTFFLQYQHAVVARSYCLSTLLAFSIGALWSDRERHFLAIGVLLALLCQTNLFGFALAGSLTGVLWLGLLLDPPKQLPLPRKRAQLWAATLLVIASACIAAWLSFSPPDLSFPGTNSLSKIPLAYLWGVIVINTRLVLLLTFGSAELGGLLLLTLAAWLGESRRQLYLIPFAVMLLVTSVVYAKSWHLGMLIVALLMSVWLGWPEEHGRRSNAWSLALSGVLLLCFLVQLRWTAISVHNDIVAPYSGAKAAADYIRPRLGNKPLYGAHYHTVGMLAYFEHNIFVNQPAHSYWAWSYNDMSDLNVQMKRYSGPATVVLAWASLDRDLLPALLQSQQFRLTHRFCGHLFVRDTYSEMSCYDIYERD